MSLPQSMLRVDVQRELETSGLPSDAEFATWAEAVLGALETPAELVIRLVSEAESRQLNLRYRQQDKATNVLSFPGELDATTRELLLDSGDFLPLGDLVICAPVVDREAAEQGKPPTNHWAHMVIHGALHLLGFDHQEEQEAQQMEDRERRILAGLGLPDPYLAG
jgi:probable rRNA maturation factor